MKFKYHYNTLLFIFQKAWFGGDVASIVGKCACPYEMVWDDHEVYCKTDYSATSYFNLTIFILIPTLILCGCCCYYIFVVRTNWRDGDNSDANTT